MHASLYPKWRLGRGSFCLTVGGFLFLAAGTAFAGSFSLWPQHFVDVVTVTDTTAAGYLAREPSPGQPVYYEACNFGYCEFGQPMAGEHPPANETMLRLIVKTLVGQGYVVADDKHPPTQFIVFAWGTLRVGAPGFFGPAKGVLRFLGGEKLDLMRDADPPFGLQDFRILFKSKGSLAADKIYDAAKSDLYVALIRSYDFDAINEKRLSQLWETRIACPSTGLALETTLPMVIAAAGPNIGRETDRPVWVDASDKMKGHVEIGDVKVLEYLDPEQHPVIDLSKREGATREKK